MLLAGMPELSGSCMALTERSQDIGGVPIRW